MRSYFGMTVTDANGTIVPAASIRVENPGLGTLVSDTLYSALTGAGALANPLTADANGWFYFYLNAPRLVDLTISGTGYIARTVSAVVGEAGLDHFDTTATGDGVTDDTAALQADVTTVAATAHKRLHLPAGTYRVTATTGILIDLSTNNNLEVYGDGTGKTIVSFDAGVILAGETNLFALNGSHQAIRDLSIQIGLGTPGVNTIRGVEVDTDALYPTVERVEISGMFGGGNAGGAGLSTYRAWDEPTNTTTLGTAVAAPGAVECTPGSMAGIYDGAWLRIDAGGAAQEDLVVTSVTATTFTATFANAQDADHAVWVMGNGAQFGTYRDIFIHDATTACGICCNSRSNLFENVRIVKVGASALQHGFYVQQGNNEARGCYVEGAAGYSFQDYQASEDHLEDSANRYINCVSVNPATGHAWGQAHTSASAENPQLLAGLPINRVTQYIDCQFRCTKDFDNTPSGITLYVSALVSGCWFEDTCLAAGNGAIIASGAGVKVSVAGCAFTSLRTTGNECLKVGDSAVVVCTGNTVKGWPADVVVDEGGLGSVYSGNHIVAHSASALVTLASGAIFANNYVENQDTTAKVLTFEGQTGLEISGNSFVGAASDHVLLMWQNTATAGAFHDNAWTSGVIRYDVCPAGLLVYDNSGMWAQIGDTTDLIAFGRGSGRFWGATSSTGTNTTPGMVVKFSSGLTFLPASTADEAAWVGVCVSSCLSGAYPAYITGQPGDVVYLRSTGAWTRGNVGRLSTGAGNIKDTASVALPTGAGVRYVIFLTSGDTTGNPLGLICEARA